MVFIIGNSRGNNEPDNKSRSIRNLRTIIRRIRTIPCDYLEMGHECQPRNEE
jgi:hypothetical protein